MTNFFYRHSKLKKLVYIILVIVLIIIIVPYIIPLGENQNKVSSDSLITENGKFIDIDGMNIYVEEHGLESSQTAIVFLHGFGGSTFSWRYNVPFFVGKGYRVVTLDMKGFGLSYKDLASDYSHPAQAKIIADVLTKLNINQAYFIGHSMGASVMFHFAHLYPHMVIGLISVDGALSLDKGSVLSSVLISFNPFQRASRVFLTHYINKDRINTILESAYYNKQILSPEVLDGYYNRLVSGNWDQALLAMTREMHKNTISFSLESITSPTLILWGENDTWVTRADIDKWRDKITYAEFYAIPSVGHLLMEEKPELFNDIVLTFIESVQK